MGVSEIGFPQNVVYKQRIQTSDTLPVTIGASKYCEFLFDIDAGDRMTPLGIVGWGCNDKTQVFLLDFYMDNDLQTAKLILKNPYATTIDITSLYIDVIYSKQALDMSEVDVVDNLTTDSAVAALSARQGKILGGRKVIVESLVLHSIISDDTGTLTAYSNRKCSDYVMLMFVMRAESDGTIRDSKIIYPGALGSIMLYAHHGVSLENLSGMTIAKTSDTTFSVTKIGAKALRGIEVIGIKFA